jgi:hypothetical protein
LRTTITDYNDFPERTHYIFGQEGWQEAADYALDWAIRQLAEESSNAEMSA